MLPNVSETLKRSFKISMLASSRVLWVCFIWCDSFSSQVVIAVAFGTAFFSYSDSNTCTRLQKYVSIYAHMHTERQIQSDSALRSTCLISFQSSSTVLLFKMPKATFPTLLISLPGCGAFDKARPSMLPSVGHTLLNAFLQVRRSTFPLITRELGLQRWPCTLVLGNPRRPFFLVVTWS